ncbi:FosX/FosE/FosI family fosfomycin resistance hydrolase [Thermodesulfobacteriota bacterium]
MIEGLSHITFIVKNLKRTSNFLTSVFEAEEIYSSGEKEYSYSKEKYFLINGLWFVIMEGEPLSEKTYNHVALKVSDAVFNKYEERIRSLGLEVIDDRIRIDGEGKSLYFYDYDNHLFELHTGTLDQRLDVYNISI